MPLYHGSSVHSLLWSYNTPMWLMEEHPKLDLICCDFLIMIWWKSCCGKDHPGVSSVSFNKGRDRNLKYPLLRSRVVVTGNSMTMAAKMSSAICRCVICLVCDGRSSIASILFIPHPSHTHTPQVMFIGLAGLHTAFCSVQGDVRGPGGTREDGSCSAANLVLSTAPHSWCLRSVAGCFVVAHELMNGFHGTACALLTYADSIHYSDFRRLAKEQVGQCRFKTSCTTTIST